MLNAFWPPFKVQEKQTNKRPYDQILLYIDLPMDLRIMHRYSNVPVKIKHNVILYARINLFL